MHFLLSKLRKNSPRIPKRIRNFELATRNWHLIKASISLSFMIFTIAIVYYHYFYCHYPNFIIIDFTMIMWCFQIITYYLLLQLSFLLISLLLHFYYNQFVYINPLPFNHLLISWILHLIFCSRPPQFFSHLRDNNENLKPLLVLFYNCHMPFFVSVQNFILTLVL